MSKSFATAAFPHLIMVYGTLKRGRSNNRVIVGSNPDKPTAQFIDSCLTHGAHVMSGLSVWRADGGPCVDYENGEPELFDAFWGDIPQEFIGRVRGELYRVNDAGLANCDKLEGHPFHWHRAPTMVTLETIMHDGPIDANIYLYAANAPDFLQLPDEMGVLSNNPDFGTMLRRARAQKARS